METKMVEPKLPPLESHSQRDQAIAAMRGAQGKPGTLQQGNGPSPIEQAGQRANLYHEARQVAEFVERVGADADDAARLYASECSRLAEEFRKVTDQFLVRLIGQRK